MNVTVQPRGNLSRTLARNFCNRDSCTLESSEEEEEVELEVEEEEEEEEEVELEVEEEEEEEEGGGITSQCAH